MKLREVLVAIFLLSLQECRASRPEELCIDPVVPTPGKFYAIKVNSRFYKRGQPLEVEVYQTIQEKRPIIADVFLHAPETDLQSPSFAMDVKSLGYWLPKQPSEFEVTASTVSCPYSLWGNDAISAYNDRELKFNLTGTWYPPTSDYDIQKRQFIKFVAYVTPDPDRTRRRWYKVESKVIRNFDFIVLQYRMKQYRRQMKLVNQHLEQFN